MKLNEEKKLIFLIFPLAKNKLENTDLLTFHLLTISIEILVTYLQKK